MDKLRAMQAFVAVVNRGGFTAAGRALELPASSITRRVRALEEELGTKLLRRTTRSVRLTEVGASYLDRCRAILEEIEKAEEAVGALQETPRGVLKLLSPPTFSEHAMVDVIAPFLLAHPLVSIDMVLSERAGEMTAGDYDVAIVSNAEVTDESLIVRPVLRGEGFLVASPRYLDARGRPEKVSDLADHDLITKQAPWPDGGTIPGHVRLRVDDDAVRRRAAVAGLGITMVPPFLIGEDLRAGRLETVLETSLTIEGTLYVVYQQRAYLTAKGRAFVDHLLESFESPPLNSYRLRQ